MSEPTTDTLLRELLDDQRAARARIGRIVFWTLAVGLMVGVVWLFVNAEKNQHDQIMYGPFGKPPDAIPVRVVR